ncbi:MAG: hypothetical protein F4057_09680 [Acidobacteria bacterium]|nr:hypothetical protein [Acidobacteriota bacterium]MYI75559.1 hypothetical protein [Acidobacteriota bacterium]
MNRNDRAGGEGATLRRARTPEEVGRLLMAGAVVEMDPETAAAVGACADDCIDFEDAFAAAADPAEFGDEGPRP